MKSSHLPPYDTMHSPSSRLVLPRCAVRYRASHQGAVAQSVGLGILSENGGLSLSPRGVFSVGAVKMGIFPAKKVIPTAIGVSPTAIGISPTAIGVIHLRKSAGWWRGGGSRSAEKIPHFVKDRIQRAVFPPSTRGRFSPEHQTNNKTRNLTTKQNSNITHHNINH